MRRAAVSPLPWLAGLLALYLLAPIVAFVIRLRSGVSAAPGVEAALLTSLFTATISTAVITALGTPLAYLLARRRGVVSRTIGVLVLLSLAIPPLMSGLLLLYVVGPYTAAGRLFGGRLTDTRAGIVLAQTFVAAPFLIVAARSAFAAVDPSLEDVAASLGHGPVARFLRVAVPAAAPGIAAGMALAWLRSFGEFGATVILAYHPYSLPVFTFVQFDATGLPATTLPVAAALGTAVILLGLGEALRRPDPLRLWRRRLGRAPVAPAVTFRHHDPTPLRFDVAGRVGDFALDIAYAADSPRLALLGPSGAGKTFTLRLLAGLARSERADVRAGGRALHALSPERRGVGYVPQQSALMPRRSVWRQVTFGKRARPELAAWWLERLGLRGLEGRYPHELSGGQARRVALARALAVDPAVLLLDEPFSGLDAPVRDQLRRELRAVQRETQLSTVIVTHDPDDAALLADDVVIIDRGHVLQSGPRAGVFRAPRSVQVAALLGIANAQQGRVCGEGRVESAGVELCCATRDLPVGTGVGWCVRPESIAVAEDGAYGAEVVDLVDLGAVFELTLLVGRSLRLIARVVDPPALAVGGLVRVDVPVDAVSVWGLATGEAPQPSSKATSDAGVR